MITAKAPFKPSDLDYDESRIGAWLVPFVDGQWRPAAVYNTDEVIWSGLSNHGREKRSDKELS
jgi:hypothetical protein